MGTEDALSITRDLSEAFLSLSPSGFEESGATIAIAVFALSLTEGYGLSDTQEIDPIKLELPALPPPVRLLLNHFFTDVSDREALRNDLYQAFVAVADTPGARKTLNKNEPLTDLEVLLLGQTAWNIEQNQLRPRLPLAPRTVEVDTRLVAQDIGIPGTTIDLGTLHRTARGKLKGVPGKSSGHSFRRQTARLAVLVGQHLAETMELVTLDGEIPRVERRGNDGLALVWPFSLEPGQDAPAGLVAELGTQDPRPGHRFDVSSGPVLVGAFPELGGTYQKRGFEQDIQDFWSGSGDRRIWLTGGPGIGKTYAARRIVQDALQNFGNAADDLVIWVDNATPGAFVSALLKAADQVPALGVSDDHGAQGSDETAARRVLAALRSTTVRWLIVLDSADAEDLVAHQLIPSGMNPSGRVLITAPGVPSQAENLGRQVSARSFSTEEAEAYLGRRLPEQLAEKRVVLAQRLRYHPLAVATSTIAAHRMNIEDWLVEFTEAAYMDEAGDSNDPGGYPGLIGETWRIALDRAAAAFPEHVISRAALIAALQAPQGHPTALWRRAPILDWIAAGTVTHDRLSRIHPAAKQLIEYGILMLDGNWKDGRIQIHQLAARAIRESAAPADIHQAATALTYEWLLLLTEDTSLTRAQDLRTAMLPLASIPDLPPAVERMVNALLDHAERELPRATQVDRLIVDALASDLEACGATGLERLAEVLSGLGRGELVNDQTDAREFLVRASHTYRQALSFSDVDGQFGAGIHEALADIEFELGNTEGSNTHRSHAALLRKRLYQTGSKTTASVRNALALAVLHQHPVEEHGSFAELLDHALTEYHRVTIVAQGNRIMDWKRVADAANELSTLLASVGRINEAIEVALESNQVLEQLDPSHLATIYSKKNHLHLGRLYTQIKDWNRAENHFTRGGASQAIKASLEYQRGRPHQAERLLSGFESSQRINGSKHTQDHGENSFGLSLAEIASMELHSIMFRAQKEERWGEAAKAAEAWLRWAAIGDATNTPEKLYDVASMRAQAGYCQFQAGRPQQAFDKLTAAQASFRLLSELDPSDPQPTNSCLDTLHMLTLVSNTTGRFELAVRYALQWLELQRTSKLSGRLFTEESLFGLLSSAFAKLNNTSEAVHWAGRRVAKYRTAVELNPVSQAAWEDLSTALGWLSICHRADSKLDEAISTQVGWLEAYLNSSGEGEPDTDYQLGLVNGLNLTALLWIEAGNFEAAQAAANRSLTITRQLATDTPGAPKVLSAQGLSSMMLAQALGSLDRVEEAIAVFTTATNVLRLPAELTPEADGPSFRVALYGLAELLNRLGRSEEATAAVEEARDHEHRFPNASG